MNRVITRIFIHFLAITLICITSCKTAAPTTSLPDEKLPAAKQAISADKSTLVITKINQTYDPSLPIIFIPRGLIAEKTAALSLTGDDDTTAIIASTVAAAVTIPAVVFAVHHYLTPKRLEQTIPQTMPSSALNSPKKPPPSDLRSSASSTAMGPAEDSKISSAAASMSAHASRLRNSLKRDQMGFLRIPSSHVERNPLTGEPPSPDFKTIPASAVKEELGSQQVVLASTSRGEPVQIATTDRQEVLVSTPASLREITPAPSRDKTPIEVDAFEESIQAANSTRLEASSSIKTAIQEAQEIREAARSPITATAVDDTENPAGAAQRKLEADSRASAVLKAANEEAEKKLQQAKEIEVQAIAQQEERIRSMQEAITKLEADRQREAIKIADDYQQQIAHLYQDAQKKRKSIDAAEVKKLQAEAAREQAAREEASEKEAAAAVELARLKEQKQLWQIEQNKKNEAEIRDFIDLYEAEVKALKLEAQSAIDQLMTTAMVEKEKVAAEDNIRAEAAKREAELQAARELRARELAEADREARQREVLQREREKRQRETAIATAKERLVVAPEAKKPLDEIYETIAGIDSMDWRALLKIPSLITNGNLLKKMGVSPLGGLLYALKNRRDNLKTIYEKSLPHDKQGKAKNPTGIFGEYLKSSRDEMIKFYSKSGTVNTELIQNDAFAFAQEMQLNEINFHADFSNGFQDQFAFDQMMKTLIRNLP